MCLWQQWGVPEVQFALRAAFNFFALLNLASYNTPYILLESRSEGFWDQSNRGYKTGIGVSGSVGQVHEAQRKEAWMDHTHLGPDKRMLHQHQETLHWRVAQALCTYTFPPNSGSLITVPWFDTKYANFYPKILDFLLALVLNLVKIFHLLNTRNAVLETHVLDPSVAPECQFKTTMVKNKV